MNLLLALGRYPDAGDQHLAALPADFERITQVGAQLVEGGNDLQFFGERRGCGGFRGSVERTRRHTRLARHAAVGSSYGACGICLLVDQFRHFHPVAIAELKAAFDRLQVRGAEFERGAQEFAIFCSGFDVVTIRLGRDGILEVRQLIAPCGVRSGAQRIVPIVVGGVEQAGDFGFPRGRLGGHTDDARHLAVACGDAHAPDGGGARLRGLDGLL